MEPRIEMVHEKKLVEKRLRMSLQDNKTGELWRSLMPERKKIQHSVGTELYSLQVYEPLYFKHFNPAAIFEKWALVEVNDFDNVPPGMETFVLTAGLYAVFIHKGSNTDTKTFEYIFTEWLPRSGYVLDNRPHFEILGEKYKNADPDSEEEIWIPIRSINQG